MELAQKHGVYIQLSLTNNWNPRPAVDNITDPLSPFRFGRRDVTPGTNNNLPRGSLSNDYGVLTIPPPEFGIDNRFRRDGCLRSTIWWTSGT